MTRFLIAALALACALSGPAQAMSLATGALPPGQPRWAVAAACILASSAGIVLTSRAFDRGRICGVRAAGALGFVLLLLFVTGPALAGPPPARAGLPTIAAK